MEYSNWTVKCSGCGRMDYIKPSTLTIFGRAFTMQLCIFCRATYSDLMENEMENKMEHSNVQVAPSKKYSIIHDDEHGGDIAGLVVEYSNGDVETVMDNDMEDSIQEMMEYYMEYDGMDTMDAIDKVMEDYKMEHSTDDMEYCGRMNARCYYCWLEMEHSNRAHDESVVEYSKFGSWPSQ